MLEGIPLETEPPEKLLERFRRCKWKLRSQSWPETLEADENSESKPDWQDEKRDTSVSLRMLHNSLTGDIHSTQTSRTRSGRHGGGHDKASGGEGVGNTYALCCKVPRECTLPVLLGAVGVGLSKISHESRKVDHVITLQVTLTDRTRELLLGQVHSSVRR